jgi:pyrroloquinoline-quinone synthase
MKPSRAGSNGRPWPKREFLARLRVVGAQSYHDKHPFHVLMNDGKLNRVQVQGWVANRFYYQTQIPIKDAAILANCPERDIRRVWIQRIMDHDGMGDDIGGIEKWLRLGEAVGLSRGELLSQTRLLPGVRYAVDAYVQFCRSQLWVISMAASLTELFAPALMSKRIAAFRRHYPWVNEKGLGYFRGRLTQAPRDADFALRLVLERCRTPEQQQQAVDALTFKCELLWAMLDAVHFAFVINPEYADDRG